MVCLLQKYYFTSQEIEIGKSGKTVNREFKQIVNFPKNETLRMYVGCIRSRSVKSDDVSRDALQ